MTCSQISGVTAAPRSRGLSRPALLAMADHVSADALVERQASLDFDERDQHSILVVGAEQQKTMPPVDGANMLGAAADYHNEKPQYGDFMFPKLFARIAQI